MDTNVCIFHVTNSIAALNLREVLVKFCFMVGCHVVFEKGGASRFFHSFFCNIVLKEKHKRT
jgi:hypothetical protein